VAVIVALLSLTQGLSNTAAGLVHLGDADFAVFQSGVSDPTTSILPESFVGKLASRPYVAQATPYLIITNGIPSQPAAIVFGAEANGFFARRLVFESGAAATGTGQIALGDTLASDLHVGVGGRLRIDGHSFLVSGVYHSGIFFEDTGAVLPLAVAQAISGRGGEETSVAVNLTPGVSQQVGEARVKHDFPGVQVIGTAQEATRAGANGILIGHAITLFVVIALIIGGITVTNTMAMSVLERQGELALLSTVGWSPVRVATSVVGEGVIVSVIGAAIGLLLGVIGSQLLVDALGVGAWVSPSVTAWGLGRGLLVGIAIGVLGGIYPAWRVTRMPLLKGLARAA